MKCSKGRTFKIYAKFLLYFAKEALAQVSAGLLSLFKNKIIFKKELIILSVQHISFLRETKYLYGKKSGKMKNLGEFKLIFLPLAILIVLTILWKITDFVGLAVLIVVFWMSWRQLLKKFIINE